MIRRGYADTPMGQIHYVTDGQGQPLLLLHQNPRSSREFSQLIPLLAPHLRVWALDTLGCGRSDSPPQRFGIGDLATAVIGVVDALGLERVSFLGVHTGAAIAMDAAASLGKRVDSLITVGFPWLDPSERAAVAEENSARAGRTAEFTPDGSHLSRHWGWAYRYVVQHYFHLGQPPPRELTGRQLLFMREAMLDIGEAADSAAAIYRAVFTYDCSSRVPLIEAKTLFIEVDSHIEPAFCQRGNRAAQIIRDSRVLRLSKSDCSIAPLAPEKLASVVLDFLKSGSR